MSKSQDTSNFSNARQPIDVKRLTYLVALAQKLSGKSAESRKVKTEIICLVQKSDLLCQQQSQLPEEVYARGLQLLFLDICHNVDKYDGLEGAIATQIQSKFAELLRDIAE